MPESLVNLGDLSHQIGTLPEGVTVAEAMVAQIPPDVLRIGMLDHIIVERSDYFRLQSHTLDADYQQLTTEYFLQTDPSYRPSEAEVTSMAATQAALDRARNFMQNNELAAEIQIVQHRLAHPNRVRAGLAGMVLGVALYGGALGVHSAVEGSHHRADTATNQSVATMTLTPSQASGGVRVDLAGEAKSSARHLISPVNFIGASVVSVLCGALGELINEPREPVQAHRRAKKLLGRRQA